MNFRQIEAFRAIIASGSVTRAAEHMDVSQPAVSRLWSDLEKDVGFKLFTRHGRTLVPTAEARALYADVDRAFLGMTEIKASADAIRDYRLGTLNIVTMPSLAARLVPKLIAAFSATHPEIGIWLEVLPRSGVLQAAISGRYDVAIATAPVAEDGFSTRRLCQLEAYCVLPAGHRLCSRKKISIADLNGERFVALSRDALFSHTVNRLFAESGVNCQRHVQARTADAIYGLVAAGLGVSIVGPDLPSERNSDLIEFKSLSPPLVMEIDLLLPDSGNVSRLAEAFAGIAMDRAMAIVKNSRRSGNKAA